MSKSRLQVNLERLFLRSVHCQFTAADRANSSVLIRIQFYWLISSFDSLLTARS
ncbi:hypothetical protein BN8_00963 [Fibrisoma limi BUZ 3]|uniref:Uncharacterized protein n=1 Tax=Fibrisoma limi BUZ 3 TaxID=1185876 RepID=I2GDM2_9BACT|nr:hypothetical protein BN8_00963 [Fibrisoma limi BUZ 3]